jgi:hypothetical protein
MSKNASPHCAWAKQPYKTILFFVTVCFLLSAYRVSAQSDNFSITSKSFLLPQPQAKGKFTQALSIYYVVPPRIWTLDMVNAPMFNYSAKYSLGKGFNVQGGLSSLIISNRFNFGPFWNHQFGKDYLGIGYQLGFNLGMLNHFGFESTLTGWEQQPSITWGHDFGKTALTVRGDFYYTSSMNVSHGGNKIPYNSGFINGGSITTSFEQRLYKQKTMSLGLKLNYLRYHILAWPALPVNSYRYVFPEFQLGLNI